PLMDHWSRRQFVQGMGVAGLGLLAGCGRLPWQAQAPTKVPRVGVLGEGSPTDSFLEAFRQGLGEHGLAEGQNLAIEYRWARDEVERLPTLAAELVNSQTDVLVAGGSEGAIRALMSATSTIPIVMVAGPDPVRAGLIDSLARPGGNVTGLATLT